MKDLDFMHNDERQQPGQFIASVGGDGSCTIWQLPPPHTQAGVQQLAQLEPPKSKQGVARLQWYLVGPNGQQPQQHSVHRQQLQQVHRGCAVGLGASIYTAVAEHNWHCHCLPCASLPTELPKARFTRCRFARDGSMRLFTLINVGRGPSHICCYEAGPPGQPWQLLQSVSGEWPWRVMG